MATAAKMAIISTASQKLRAIDRELGQLVEENEGSPKCPRSVAPAARPQPGIFWGVNDHCIADIDDIHRTDHTSSATTKPKLSDGRIGWNSPLARALRGSSKVGDVKTVTLPIRPQGMGSDGDIQLSGWGGVGFGASNSPSPLRLMAKAIRLRTSPLKGRGKWRLASPLQGRGYRALAARPRRSWRGARR